MPTISVVAPAYNEEVIISEFSSRVRQALESTGLPYELLVIDDGSRDGTFQRLCQLSAEDPRVKVVRLSRNFGQEAAIQAGLAFAVGDAIVLTDADLQDPPERIPEMIAKWQQGNQIVLAHRVRRSEHLGRRLLTRLFHWLFQRLSHFDDGGEVGLFSLLDRQAADVLRQMPERHRYLRGLRSYVGFKKAFIEYERDARDGVPRQSVAKLLRIATDGLLSFSYVPLRLSLFMGLIISAFCTVYATVLVVLWGLNINYVKGFTTVAVAIMFLGGVQLVAIGIIGEYLGRIYEEVKRRPNYVVETTVGL